MSTSDRARLIANTMYKQYEIEQRDGRDCGSLLLDWIKERFWGKVVQDHIPIFEEIYGILSENGNIGSRNSYTHGDIDNSVWIEKTQNPDNKRVIASKCHCSCADDNTHLYILDNLTHRDILTFRCRTVWPRQSNRGGYRVAKSEKNPDGWVSWGDDRDISIPSIATYRKRDFDFSYRDCRDKGHVFTYDELNGPTLDHAHWHENRILPALDILRHTLNMLRDYDTNECK